MTEGLTRDGFLGGRLQVWQPAAGYRAGNDPVLLAAACTARAKDTVLELGAGVGVASLCLAHRVPGLRITAVERHAPYADLAMRNAEENALSLEVVTADIGALPADLRRSTFDHVIANPPYFPPASGTRAQDAGRAGGRQEETPLGLWFRIAAARLRPKGWLTVIQSADRLPHCLNALEGFGAIAVLPLQARPGRDANRIILRARKGARAAFRLHAPVAMHDGDRHVQDRESYTTEMMTIFRKGGPIAWPDGN